MYARILLVGSGGREHALAWKLAQSPQVDHIYAVPGNGGTARLGAKVSNVNDVSSDNFEQLLQFAIKQNINLLVPGPEAPLVDGIADYFNENGPASIDIFGPSKNAARMEGSKAFSKAFMKKYNIPTAAFESFSSYEKAVAFLEANKDKKWVIKADGLAAGKGVIIPTTHEEALQGVTSIMKDRDFGAAGDEVVIEELLEGEEVSILSFSDGVTVRSLPAAQDHKRAFDDDKGPNTGGMGCYAPTGVVTDEIMERINREAIEPTIRGMRRDRYPFAGCLFTGLMITKQGPKVLEYNVRFGDPECQTLLPLLESDLVQIMRACCEEKLNSIEFRVKPQFSTTVVIAAKGYPGKYAKGVEMNVGDPPDTNTFFFHAGTSLDKSTNKLVTSGGRVIASTAIGADIGEATKKAYVGVESIEFDGRHSRSDIAHHELKRQKHTPPSKNTQNALTYASSGVSISAGNDLVSRIKPLVKATKQPGMGATIGGFGGDIDLAAAGYPSTSPTIIAAIDGIGTKVRIAQQAQDYSTVGIDLVAMNVNDLIVQGARPLAFLDYYACGRLDVDAAAAFVSGVAEGCKQAKCALIGGETAEMPSLYADGDFDAAGCAIGALAREAEILPAMRHMVEGDVLLGLASSGCHSNGFSLVRRIVERAGLAYGDIAPWEQDGKKTIAQSLLTPTRIYVQPLLAALESSGDSNKPNVKGMAHITGGGLVENIPRMLPEGLEARLKIGSWPVPPVLQWLKKAGALENTEFARTFNTGLGMVLVVGRETASNVTASLREAGEQVFEVGSLHKRRPSVGGEAGVPDGVVLEGLESWNALGSM